MRGMPRKVEPEHKINEKITAQEVRVVGEGIEPNVYPIAKALEFAEEAGLDLVEIVPNAVPPVCRVVDYSKFLYDKKKKEKEIKSKTAKVVIKEIRFTPTTDDHDIEFKANHAKKFLDEGAKVKVYVFFKGRMISYQEQGKLLLLKFAEKLADISTMEAMPVLEGKKMFMFLVAKAKKK